MIARTPATRVVSLAVRGIPSALWLTGESVGLLTKGSQVQVLPGSTPLSSHVYITYSVYAMQTLCIHLSYATYMHQMCDLTRYTDTYASTDGTTHAAGEDRTTLSLRIVRLRGPRVARPVARQPTADWA